jgi:hypothetical protein
MIAEVQSWVDTPQSNRGWILVGDETTENSAKRFDSKDHANAGVRPRLEISFTGTPTAATRDVVPDLAYLEGNYPNPFQSQTTILYTLDKPQHVILELIDLQGRIIQTLIHTDQSAGLHQIRLEANELPGGVYLCRLTTETSSRYQKLVLQK